MCATITCIKQLEYALYALLIGSSLLLYYKEGQLLLERPVYLHDTRTNGDPCLLSGQMQVVNRILYDIMPFR